MIPVDTLFRLDGRVALVTGAARGFGYDTAMRLAQAGATVMIGDLDEDATLTAADALRAQGLNVHGRRMDVTCEDDWRDTIDACTGTLGGLDILVNNAGIFVGALIENTSLEQVRKLNQVNIESIYLGCRYAAEAMKPEGAAGRGGSIINLSSIAGLTGTAGVAAYGTTKGAVRLMSKHAAVEYGRLGYGIRVNSVHPGIHDTKMGEAVYDTFVGLGAAATPEEAREVLTTLIPAGRMGNTEDIANAVLFLASDASKYMTGSELVVDGGYSAT